MFNAFVMELRLKSRKVLILDCPKRWNSTFEIINQALEYKDALLRYGNETRMQVSDLDEWKNAELVARFLESFLVATKIFSAVKRPTSHRYIKEVWAIRQQLFDEEVRSNEILWSLSREMQRKFYKYWEYPNLILSLASILDPRSKMVFLDFCFNMLMEKRRLN
jgi:Domain of unknown function (DUF4413)